MKKAPLLFIFLSIFHFSGCGQGQVNVAINASGTTLRTRIAPPKGYQWVSEPATSFGHFLHNLPVKRVGSQILDYTGSPIGNQSEHIAVINYDIGYKNLQQCADALIRLRAEYLWRQKRYDELKFHFTNGDLFTWDQYKRGIRPRENAAHQMNYFQLAGYDNSYQSFQKYLETIFIYAGTISLNQETSRVQQTTDIKTGDLLIAPGSPGHAVIIAGTAKNNRGDKVFLLAEGYTPAQSIHVITNPFGGGISPWYKLDVHKSPTMTARYGFTNTNIRRFK